MTAVTKQPIVRPGTPCAYRPDSVRDRGACVSSLLLVKMCGPPAILIARILLVNHAHLCWQYTDPLRVYALILADLSTVYSASPLPPFRSNLEWWTMWVDHSAASYLTVLSLLRSLERNEGTRCKKPGRISILLALCGISTQRSLQYPSWIVPIILVG